MNMSTDTAPDPRDRRTEIRRLIDAMEHAKVISDGHFSALGMLITDASLSADEQPSPNARTGCSGCTATISTSPPSTPRSASSAAASSG